MSKLVTTLLALALGACGAGAGPTFVPPLADGGASLDGGAAATDGGSPSSDGGAAATDGGAATFADCPASDGGVAGGSVVVMNPLTGELGKRYDLSCFAENAGYPRPANLSLARDKVYVTLQDFDANFTNFKTAKVVVIDPAREHVLRKITLTGHKNAADMRVGPDGRVYVATQGVLGLDFPGFTVEPELSGGIDIVDPATDTVVRSIDDDAFGGNVTKLELATPTRAYAIVAIFDTTVSPKVNRYYVKRFNPATGAVDATAVYAATGDFVSGLVYDSLRGKLYVAEGDYVDPRIVAIDEPTGTVDTARAIPLALTPQSMDLFIRGPERKLLVVEPDFSGGVGAVQVVDVSGQPPLHAVTAADPVSSDPVVRLAPIPGALPQEPQAYVINRYQADNIQWLDPDTAFATRRQSGVAAQWSTGNGSNPQDVLPVSATKLYVTLQD